ncbi:unnamed protein product [Didymodactylos carnosus]|uniref:Hermes trasposase DNA-binding domain-containing protein n=1 Tax=Didymodactylos carnosus TaxID=1234261 RepID=A0A8S2E524_9BILA|nr:unnamed protein product [Didymodactylos carnosus]CAF3834563.1 unnamed protein product [Didymodactylos carnosus]
MSKERPSLSSSLCHTPPRPSSSLCHTPPLPSSPFSSTVLTSASIKRSLMTDKNRYRVQPNPSKRATAACWKVFGVPAMSTDDDPTKYEILPGFVSCKTCLDTYKYIDSSTGNLNNHRCCRESSPDQSSIASFLHLPRSTNSNKLISKRKEEIKQLCAKWVAGSMRSFQIVTDRGLKDSIQACLDIGREFRSETRVHVEDLLPSDRTVIGWRISNEILSKRL